MARPLRERADIDEHDRDDLLDAAQPGIARQDLLRGLAARRAGRRSAAAALSRAIRASMWLNSAMSSPNSSARGKWTLRIEPALRDALRRDAQLIDRLGDEPADHQRGAKAESDADGADENGEPGRIGSRRGRREAQEQERTDRANARGNRPEQSAPAQRKRPAARREVGARIAKKRGEKSPMARQFDEKETVRDGDESGDEKRDRQMPEQPRDRADPEQPRARSGKRERREARRRRRWP